MEIYEHFKTMHWQFVDIYGYNIMFGLNDLLLLVCVTGNGSCVSSDWVCKKYGTVDYDNTS